jgi:hypothetical protein
MISYEKEQFARLQINARLQEAAQERLARAARQTPGHAPTPWRVRLAGAITRRLFGVAGAS